MKKILLFVSAMLTVTCAMAGEFDVNGTASEYKDMDVYVKNNYGFDNEIYIWDWEGGDQRDPKPCPQIYTQGKPGERVLDMGKVSGWGYYHYTNVENATMKAQILWKGGTEYSPELTLFGETVCIDMDGNSVDCPTTDADEIGADATVKNQKIIDASTGERYILKANGEKVNF